MSLSVFGRHRAVLIRVDVVYGSEKSVNPSLHSP